MTDPRYHDVRLAVALYCAGERGGSRKHDLMLRAAKAIGEVERTLGIIWIALERGDLDLAKLRLQHIENVLGSGNVVINSDRTERYSHDTKQDTSENED